MTVEEYHLCAHGYFLRHNRNQEPFRRLYMLLWNINSGRCDQIRSVESLQRKWPLLTDEGANPIPTNEAIQKKWDEAITATRKMKNK